MDYRIENDLAADNLKQLLAERKRIKAEMERYKNKGQYAAAECERADLIQCQCMIAMVICDNLEEVTDDQKI